MTSKNQIVRQYMARLVNAFASLAEGKWWSKHHCFFVARVIVWLYALQDTDSRKNFSDYDIDIARQWHAREHFERTHICADTYEMFVLGVLYTWLTSISNNEDHYNCYWNILSEWHLAARTVEDRQSSLNFSKVWGTGNVWECVMLYHVNCLDFSWDGRNVFARKSYKEGNFFPLTSIPCCVDARRSGLPLPNPHSPETPDGHSQDGGKRLPDSRERLSGPAEAQPQVHDCNP